ncbi:MAG TPA: 2-dehydropantoate 2-reductase [Candidatus Binatia bacterium]|nr:2-dehydropantoate 2-reductase [Candidatus Binatia bacterium]
MYGAGAVGCYLGAYLVQQGHDVTLVTRIVAAEAIKKSGLRVSHPSGSDLLVNPNTVTALRQAFLDDQRYDLLLLAVKAYDVDEALNPLIAFAPRPYPPVLALQNGIGVEELIIQALQSDDVIAGSLTTPVSRLTPDHVRIEHADRGLALAPTHKKQDIKNWVKLFEEAQIATQRVGNHRSMKWSKALLNMMGNASSAILNRHPRAIYKYEPTYNLEMEMLQEALAVMKRLKIKVVDLPGTPTTRLALAVRRLPEFMVKPVLTRIVAEGRGDKMPSFHVDLSNGRTKSEVLFHNGAVAAASQELGIPTPVNQALSDILLKLARREIDWKTFDGNPQRLLQEVEKYRD